MVAVEETLVELIFFEKIVVARLFTADGKLLQPTECVNGTPSHVTFFVFHSTHFNVAHDIGSKCLSASRHPCFMRRV